MLQSPDERLVAEEIRRAVGPAPVILCGSRATGTAHAASDYDVVVVVPAHRIPRALGPLRQACTRLERRLGVDAAVNPLPPFRLRRPGPNLLVWKLRSEGRVLSAPAGFELAPAPPPPLSRPAASSYSLSGLRFLTSVLEGSAAERQRGVRKALLHAAQLRLLEDGRYAATFEQALPMLPAHQRAQLAALAADPGSLESWVAARDLLLASAHEPRVGRIATRVANAQYCALSALRGRGARLQALARGEPVGATLGRAATLLARAVRRDGSLDRRLVEAANDALPPFLRPAPLSWRALRDAVEAEWPQANPLLGL
jgi:Nucleotidyltransferase domain